MTQPISDYMFLCFFNPKYLGMLAYAGPVHDSVKPFKIAYCQISLISAHIVCKTPVTPGLAHRCAKAEVHAVRMLASQQQRSGIAIGCGGIT